MLTWPQFDLQLWSMLIAEAYDSKQGRDLLTVATPESQSVVVYLIFPVSITCIKSFWYLS